MSTIAVCQIRIEVGAVEANRRAAESAVEQASDAGAEFVVLPELCDSGYVFSSRAEAVALAESVEHSATLQGWSALCERLGLVVVGGFCERAVTGELYNSAAVIDPSGVRCVYRKAHLWDREKLVFSAGSAPPTVVETAVGRVAALICYDLEFPEWVRQVALGGADLIAAPTNWPWSSRPEAERPAEVVKAQADAAVNGVVVAVADRCGEERGVRWVGGSAIIGIDGYPLAGPVLDDRPALLLADVDLSRARNKRIGAHNDLFSDRRESIYVLNNESRRGAATPSDVG